MSPTGVGVEVRDILVRGHRVGPSSDRLATVPRRRGVNGYVQPLGRV